MKYLWHADQTDQFSQENLEKNQLKYDAILCEKGH